MKMIELDSHSYSQGMFTVIVKGLCVIHEHVIRKLDMIQTSSGTKDNFLNKSIFIKVGNSIFNTDNKCDIFVNIFQSY